MISARTSVKSNDSTSERAAWGLSIVVPAHNEATVIAACLDALLAAQTDVPVQVIVVANGCRDETADIAREYTDKFTDKGWRLNVLDLPQGGKPNALNQGDDAALFANRIYLDADVTVQPDMLRDLATVLNVPEPRYASGTLNIVAPDNFFSRAYARIWRKVPFMAQGVPGCGLFAVNAAGRERWAEFPEIISDDTYVRLQFDASERVAVPAGYDWPVVAGLGNLIKVRARQDRGVAEVRAKFPDLVKNEDTPAMSRTQKLKMALSDPIGFLVYSGVAVAVRLRPNTHSDWSRGR